MYCTVFASYFYPDVKWSGVGESKRKFIEIGGVHVHLLRHARKKETRNR